jgi:hypothetical protein
MSAYFAFRAQALRTIEKYGLDLAAKKYALDLASL